MPGPVDIADMPPVRMVPIDSVRPHPANPRRGSVAKIGESIDAFGFFGAIIAQESTGLILVGNHRYLAARAAGRKKVPVQFLDVDDAGAMRILLADNRTSDLAQYDDAALADLLRDLSGDADGLLGTGYSEADLEELLVAGDEEEGEAESGDVAVDAVADEEPGRRWVIFVAIESLAARVTLVKRLVGEGYDARLQT